MTNTQEQRNAINQVLRARLSVINALKRKLSDQELDNIMLKVNALIDAEIEAEAVSNQ